MTRRALMPWPVYKEVRALIPAWLACIACMVLPALINGFALRDIVYLAYCIGAVALGALSMGEEYSDRTISLLLTHPVDRARLFRIKWTVLATMLLPLVIGPAVVAGRYWSYLPASVLAGCLVPLLWALFMAPWLTMLCRSAIAGATFALTGTVFTMVMPALVLGPGYMRWLARDRPFGLALVLLGIVTLCAVGAVMSSRTFARLEAFDGPAADLRLPAWLRRRQQPPSPADAASRCLKRRNPLWLLVTKELRLQQMTFVVAALYVFGWLVVTVRGYAVAPAGDAFPVVSVLYVLLIGVMVGSLASGEERQLGTIEWQVLLPMAMWKQWTVKIGVVLGLVTALAVGLPTALEALGPGTGSARMLWQRPTFGLVLLLVAGSVYVSSLWGNGLWALMASIAATLPAAAFFTMVIVPTMNFWAETLWSGLYRVTARSVGDPGKLPPRWHNEGLDLAIIAGFAVIVMGIALENHRSADLPARRVCRQVLVVALCALAAAALSAGVGVWTDPRL